MNEQTPTERDFNESDKLEGTFTSADTDDGDTPFTSTEEQWEARDTARLISLRAEVIHLAALLTDPHPGLATWDLACENSYKRLEKLFITNNEPSEDDNLTRDILLLFAEEQERIALRVANTLGERYGWSPEEKDIVCIEVLGILTQESK